MKAVLISIQPKWCELIASGKKTVEVRKTKPKLETPFKCYIYCTNWKDNTYWANHYKGKLGKVIGEFLCDGIITARSGCYCKIPPALSQVDALDLMDYADGKPVYGWHITDLVIYDKPRELGDFKNKCDGLCYDNSVGFKCPSLMREDCKKHLKPIKRPPQSWCYVERSNENGE